MPGGRSECEPAEPGCSAARSRPPSRFSAAASRAAGATPATSSPPAIPTTRASIGLAGRHLHRRTARQRRLLLGRDAGPVLRTRRRPPELGLHPVHRRTKRPRRRQRTGRRTEDRPRRPAGRPQRQPGATDRCPLATFEAGAAGCPAGIEVGESDVTASLLAAVRPAPPMAPLTKVPVYNVEPASGRAGPLRPRTGRQRSLPRSRRRLGRRLPRGLHDRRPESAAAAVGSKG